MRAQLLIRTIATVACCAASSSLGASDPGQSVLPPGAKRVEQGVADDGPLKSSLRVIQPQLRLPQNFGDVYSFRDRDGKSKYARVSGGLTAVFDQSEYVDTRDGTLPLIPAGTIFRLGRFKGFDEVAPPRTYTSPNLASMLDSGLQSTQVSSWVDPSRPDGAAQARAAVRTEPDRAETSRERVPPAGMLSDESYRRARVRALMAEALQSSVRIASPSAENR